MRPKLVSPDLLRPQLFKNELPEIKPPKVSLPRFMPHEPKMRIALRVLGQRSYLGLLPKSCVSTEAIAAIRASLKALPRAWPANPVASNDWALTLLAASLARCSAMQLGC